MSREIKFRRLYEYGQRGAPDNKTKWVEAFMGDAPAGFACWSRPISPWLQYTGLKDENGREIYESDIVRCVNDHVGAVEWEEHDCCFNVDGYYNSSDDYPTMAFGEGQPFEIIGNIHENPDLLK